MKKLTFLITLLFMLLAACSSNDPLDENNENNENDGNKTDEVSKYPVIINSTFHYPKADLNIQFHNTDSDPVTEVGCYIGGEKNFSSGFMMNKKAVNTLESSTTLTTGSVTALADRYLLPYIITTQKGKIFGRVYIFNTNHQECSEYCDFNPKDPNIMSEILKGYRGETSSGGSSSGGDLTVSPEGVSSFVINATRKERVLNAKYIGTNKKYLLTIREYSEVTYNWSCSDSKVEGILITRSAVKPTNGVKCTDFKAIYQPRNGEYIVKEWQETTSYVDFYIWTYSSGYQYSATSYNIRKYIEGIRDYTKWSSTPYL